MTLEELKKKMWNINKCYNKYGKDMEAFHYEMDQLLLEYIGDKDVVALFWQLSRWYD